MERLYFHSAENENEQNPRICEKYEKKEKKKNHLRMWLKTFNSFD